MAWIANLNKKAKKIGDQGLTLDDLMSSNFVFKPFFV